MSATLRQTIELELTPELAEEITGKILSEASTQLARRHVNLEPRMSSVTGMTLHLPRTTLRTVDGKITTVPLAATATIEIAS